MIELNNGQIQLHLGDCLKILPEIQQEVGMVFNDLPYGITNCSWDSLVPLLELKEHYGRLVRLDGVMAFTCVQPFTTKIMNTFGEWFHHSRVWDKVSISDFLNAKLRPLRRHEDLLLFSMAKRATYHPQMETRGAPRRKGGRRDGQKGVYHQVKDQVTVNNTYYPTSILQASSAKQKDKIHATEKPLALLVNLIETYSNPGDTILDPTFGGGTTALACLKTGRRFIGIERDPDIFGMALERIRNHKTTCPESAPVA
jgi:DNA modification methylase